jgi:hypothetical protein
MKKALVAMILVAGSALAGPRVRVGFGFGAPASVAVVRPACPGPGYAWVDGYYAPNGVWVQGFWRAPEVAVRVAPRYVAPRYYDYNHDRRFHRDSRHDFHHESRDDFHR